MAGHTVVVGQLLRAGADPNAAAKDGRTALHRAVFHCWLQVVKLLLENGADPSIQDEDGKTAQDLSRRGAVRDFLEGFTAEQVQEAMEAHRQKMAARPQFEDLEDEVEEVKPKEAKPKAEAAFEPPPRKAAAALEAAAVRAAPKVKDDEAEREARYKRAIAELRLELGEDRVDDVTQKPQEITPADVAVPRIAVHDAGEIRLNGTYRASFVSKERVEFEKVGDRSCHIFWSTWHDEWRMLIADFKLGSTLYRHRHRPNVKFDECHGIPCEDWVKWFGADPAPSIRYLTEDEPDYAPAPPEAAPEESSATSPAGPRPEQQGGREYMEFHSSLDIVSKPDDFGAQRAEAAVAAATGITAHRAGSRPIDVRLSEGGTGRVVETSEGLYSSDEVLVTEQTATISPEEAKATAWLDQDTGDAPEVAPHAEAILAAKSAAQELFNEGKVRDARQATTAGIRALKRLQATQPEGDGSANKEELDALLGVLHSNRSLLLTQQIQAGDKEVLAFGQDAAWRLVVQDCDVALRESSGNFKASFRRAKALFELGELDEAMVDATQVVDHYAKNSSVSNPEAAALRQRIMEAIKKERSKWGEKGGPRWNASADKDGLISELGSEAKSDVTRSRPVAAPWMPDMVGRGAVASTAGGAVASAAARRTIPAPRNGADVEKALLSTAKGNAASQLAYIKEHVSADALRRFYRKTPLGPDLLAVLMRLLADLADEDVPAARERLSALASAPSSRTYVAMFDAQERAAFSRLLSRVGSEASSVWEDAAAPGGEGGA
eukprot:TRINITY_DN65188_c0_g1_i1.p1 TRINITY_DN65188_c0_g1~~TRINITY_DN65188_c0_g1_i1.p1  ORF type:complete len:842 (-),score=220.89 TRINITY_DN65188_c0_g1_i1:72-2405(-)